MLKKNSPKTAIITAALLLAVAIPCAWAAKVFNENIPVSGTVASDPCTGHTTEFSGTFHLVVTVTNSSNGGFHIVIRDNFENTTSFDTVTGDTCRLMNSTVGVPGTGTFVINNAPGAASTFSSAADAQLICPGPANNEIFHTVFHVTTDAQGNVTASVSDSTLRCGGDQH